MPAPTPQTSSAVVRSTTTAGTMQTAVQLTFAFEIASMQLTPAFEMGALQLRPTSKVVTMRLAGDAPQPAMGLQVTFEIARIQPAGGTLGSVRLIPSQQQRPTFGGSPSFSVGGLKLVSDFAAAPLQLTPSQQRQATVYVVAPFQISTVEFSPSFEISSIVLNSNSKQVSVQLPAPGAASVEGAPVFEISNLQLTGSGEIAMMQLNILGRRARRPDMPAVPIMSYEPARRIQERKIDLVADQSDNQDLEPFRIALRNHSDLLPETAKRIRVTFQMPTLDGFAAFAEQSVDSALAIPPVDITVAVNPEANPDYIAFYVLYPSRDVRQVAARATRKAVDYLRIFLIQLH